MVIKENKSLKNLNTFGIDVKARHFCEVNTLDELLDVLNAHKQDTLFILGGGSNMLLTKDIEAMVLHINLKGITTVSEEEDSVVVEAMAGENWHEFVQNCIENDFGGLENLSLIPGNVGTAPIQNIGAYGVELKDVFESCKAVNRKTGEIQKFDKEQCKFGYRDSIFKRQARDTFVISSVRFKLTKAPHPLNTSYGAIQKVLEKTEYPTIKDVSEAVIAIRQSKLPDPKELGNSGSFFKNPILNADDFREFRRKHSQAPFYEVSSTEFKVPAGWLIEQAGFKGKRFGDAGVHKNQALVLVNYGNATGKEIWELALHIQREVRTQFGIYLEPEVNVF